jgi:hypothetical protein
MGAGYAVAQPWRSAADQGNGYMRIGAGLPPRGNYW